MNQTTVKSAKHHEDIIPGAEPFNLGQGKKALLFIHGWTSTPRELRFLAEKLKSKYTCQGLLLKGHGTHVNNLTGTHWQTHLKQVTEAFSELSLKHDSVSVIGFSYGAILSLHLAARRKVAELVLLAPFIKSSHTLCKIWPHSELVPFLPQFIQALKKKQPGPIFNPKALKDHIHYSKMPVQPLKSVIQCAHEALKLLPQIQTPTLLIHSTGDQTADFEGSVEILKKLGSASKTLKALKQSNHIITLDHDRERVEAEILAWLTLPKV